MVVQCSLLLSYLFCKVQCAEKFDQERAAVKKKNRSSSPRNTFISGDLLLKDGFPHIKMNGKLMYLISPVSILGKFYQRQTLSVRTPEFKRQNQNT